MLGNGNQTYVYGQVVFPQLMFGNEQQSIYLGFLHRFQHSKDHIIMGSLCGPRKPVHTVSNVLYCKLLTIGKRVPTFPYKVQGLNRRPQRW